MAIENADFQFGRILRVLQTGWQNSTVAKNGKSCYDR